MTRDHSLVTGYVLNHIQLPRLSTLALLIAWITPAWSGDQVYLLQEQLLGSATDAPQYSFRSIGAVAGARKLALPQVGSHVLVLTGEGRVRAWGNNSQGQLGVGDTSAREGWVEIEELTGVVDMAAGSVHSIALLGDGTVWTWGANDQGQLGDGSLVAKLRPVAVSRLTDVTGVAAGKR